MRANGRPWPLEPMDNIDLAPDFDCPAIKRCCEAWYSAFKKAQADGINPVSVRLRANEAYRYAMPPLNTLENISDFIACVVHGMMVGCIIDELGTRWIHAARAASMLKNKMKRIESSTAGGKAPEAGSNHQMNKKSNFHCTAVPKDLSSFSGIGCEDKQVVERRIIGEEVGA